MQKHQYLVSLMEDRKEELLKLCSDLIKIPSVNPPGEMEAITSFIYMQIFRGTSYFIRGTVSDSDNPKYSSSIGQERWPSVNPQRPFRCGAAGKPGKMGF